MKKNDNKPKGKEIEWRIIFPVPNFEELKSEGSESWEEEKKDFIEQCEISGIKITDQDIKRKKLMWLEKWIEQKLKKTIRNTYPNGKIDHLIYKKKFTSAMDLYKIQLEKYQNHIKAEIADTEIKQPIESKELPEIKIPYFIPDYRDAIFEILKNYFPEHHKEFKNILKGESYNGKLLFNDNANKLADTLRRLMEAKIITQCNKKDLAKWASENFISKNGDIEKKYLYDIISEQFKEDKYYHCKNPIINIEYDENNRPKIILHKKSLKK